MIADYTGRVRLSEARRTPRLLSAGGLIVGLARNGTLRVSSDSPPELCVCNFYGSQETLEDGMDREFSLDHGFCDGTCSWTA
jgi:hypothetical protein